MGPEPLATGPRRREIELLVTCSRVSLSASDAARLATALVGELDWRYVLHAANLHGLVPLVHRHLNSVPERHVPPEVRGELRRRHGVSVQRSMMLTAALAEALRVLGDAGIDAVPFKGPLLAHAAYRDIGLRPFRDVDILVRRRDLLAAVACLERIGYSVTPGQGDVALRIRSAWVSDIVLARGNALVELHWKLTQPFFGVADSLDDVADTLVDTEIAGLPVRTLGLTELFFYLSVHGATHRWPRLEWVCDIAELLRSGAPIDWEGLGRRARSEGAWRMVSLALTLARELLGAPTPGAAASFVPMRAVRRLAAAVYRHLPDENPDPNPGLALAPFHLAVRERVRDKLRYSAAVLAAPSPLDIEAVRLPERLFPLYYVLRPFRLAAARFRSGRRVSEAS